MSNITLAQVQAILAGWAGNAAQKRAQWESTYNWTIWPPPPAVFASESALAEYIAEHYTGPAIPLDV